MARNEPGGVRLLLAALSGLLLAGALPHLDWGGLAWIGLVPFLLLFPFGNTRAAFGHGLVLGVCYLGVMAYWVSVFAAPIIGPALGAVGWVLVTAYQAFYIGVWAAGTQWLWRRGDVGEAAGRAGAVGGGGMVAAARVAGAGAGATWHTRSIRRCGFCRPQS